MTVFGRKRKRPALLSVSQKRKNSGWSSPPVKRTSEEWHSPPRKRKDTWPSPSRIKGNELSQSPRRNRSGSDMRSPPRGRSHDNWPQERRKVSESPPRFQSGGRRETREGLLTPPRSRIEEWQSRGSRTRVEPTSSPRRRPSDKVRKGYSRSPPRERTDRNNSERNKYHEREDGGYRHPHDNRIDRGRMPPRATMNENWPTHMADEFPPEGRNMENIHDQGGRMGGYPLPRGNKASGRALDVDFSRKSRERAGKGAFPHRERDLSGGLSPQEARMGGGFLPGDAKTGRDCPSHLIDEQLLLQERFARSIPAGEERFAGMMRSQDSLESGLLPIGNRMNEGFLRQEGRVVDDFPPQDIGVLISNRPVERRAVGMVRGNEGYTNRGYSPPHGQIGNDCPPPGGIPAPSQMVEGLPPHERRPDVRFPEARGSARNFSPESIMVIDIHPREGRSIELVPQGRVRVGADYPLQRGRENLPEHDGGRARMLLPENRMIERMVDEMPPQRMSGDLPPSEGKMDGSFHHDARLAGNMPLHDERPFPLHGIPLRDANPPHDGRMMGSFPPRDGRMMGGIPPHDERMMGDVPPHEERTMGNFAPHEARNVSGFPSAGGRSGGNVMLYERMSGDFPLRGGRVGDIPPPHAHMVGDMNFPPGGRFSADFPHQGRIGNNMIPPGRMVADLPPEERMGASDFPPDGRIGMPPHAGRTGDPLLPMEQFGNRGTFQGGRTSVVHPSQARFGGDPREMRMDDQHLEGRSGPDEHWNRLPFNPDQLNFGPPIKQEPSNEAEFLQHKGGDNGRNESRNQWDSQDIQHGPFQAGGNSHGPGPSFRNTEDREGGGLGPRAWRPEEPSNRGWNSEDGPERLPENTGRDGPHGSPQKQPRLVGPNIRYRHDEEQNPYGWGQKPPRGATDKKRNPVVRGAHTNLLGQEDEALAPYEQPFSQSVWDSNEPDNILFPQGSGDHAGRTRGSGGSRLQDSGSRPTNKPGSVWQRVGGYVHDDDDDDFLTSQCLGTQDFSGDKFRGKKERSYEDSNARRGHDVREGREAQNRFASQHGGKEFSSGGSRGRWRNTDKKQMGRW